MRILYYNWVDYLDDEYRGGGVSVYLFNLLRELEAKPDIEADFLSAGLSYDLGAKAPRWEKLRHGRGDRARRYEIVNSGVLSPGHHSFGNPAQLSHPETEAAFFDFLAANGPYDVVHFNNLEGIPAGVLTLKQRFPETRVLLSLHNYYPVCPQVNLWFEEGENCSGFAQGAKCIDCLPYKPPEGLVRRANALAYRLKVAGIRPGTRAFDLAFRNAIRIGGRLARVASWLSRRHPVPQLPAGPEGAAHFAARRAETVALINDNCDLVLCVSDRVGEVVRHHGIDEELLHTSYIGSAEAGKFTETAPRGAVPGRDGTLTLAYLGYMRRDKGFFFLLDALENLPDDLVGRLHLLVAARAGPAGAMARLEALRTRLAGLRHVDGYTHDGLDDLLADVDVGMVPVMWEDNLPQVAIEMHARHIPLLTSDLGGAQELANCPEMVFRAGSVDSFGDRLRYLLSGGLDIPAYWRGARAPVPMQVHLDELLRLYKGESDPDLASLPRTASLVR